MEICLDLTQITDCTSPAALQQRLPGGGEREEQEQEQEGAEEQVGHVCWGGDTNSDCAACASRPADH